MKALKGSLVPVVAVGLGVVGAGLWYAGGGVGVESPAPAPAGPRPVATIPSSAGDEAPRIEGRVSEVIDVPNYTYLRLTDASGAERWAAVSTSPVKVGDSVALDDATEMRAFASPTLKRTFDSIWFGTLRARGASAGLAPHADTGSPAQEAQAGAAGEAAGEIPAHHRSPLGGGDDVPVGHVEPASGPSGHRIAEVYAERTKLAGKTIRVRGVVVKSMSGILGKTFVHLRDGSGDAASATHDLTVTTHAEPGVGSTVLFQGIVAVDKDFGAGFTYPAVLEDATIVTK